MPGSAPFNYDDHTLLMKGCGKVDCHFWRRDIGFDLFAVAFQRLMGMADARLLGRAAIHVEGSTSKCFQGIKFGLALGG